MRTYPKPKIILRADGNKRIGFGHLFRTLSLGEMLEENFDRELWVQAPSSFLKKELESKGIAVKSLEEQKDLIEEVTRLTQDHLDGNEIVVLDGYGFDAEYQKRIKENGNPLVMIDDLAEGHYYADLVINHAAGIDEGAYSVESYTQLCLGTAYALLRLPFLEKAKRERKVDDVSSLFLSMGGSEKDALIRKALTACQELPLDSIEVLGKELGDIPGPERKGAPKLRFHSSLDVHELIGLMDSCQLFFCPASTLSLEACAIGGGLFVGMSVGNQRYIYRGLRENGAAFDLQDLNEGDGSDWKDELMKGMNDLEGLNEIIQHQKRLIDGNSPKHIRKEISKLVS